MFVRNFVFLLFFYSISGCQQAPENFSASEAGIGLKPTQVEKHAGQPDSVQHLPADGGLGWQDLGASLPTNVQADVIFQSTDGGQTWKDISAGLPVGLEVDNVFVGGGEVFIGTQKGMFSSNASSSAPVWKQAPFLPGRITGFSIGRLGMYACSYDNGLYKNVPGTDVWERMASSLEDKTVRTVLETREGNLLVATDMGIYKSANDGLHWKKVFNEGMILNLVESGGVLLAGGDQGVLRSIDGGENWTLVLNKNTLAKNTGVIGDRFVTILGTKDPTKFNPQGITSRLLTSSDAGETWQRIEQSPLPVQGNGKMDGRLTFVLDIFDIVQTGQYLLCSFDTGIYRSSDQGKTWDMVLPTFEGAFTMAVSGQVVYAVKRKGGC